MTQPPNTNLLRIVPSGCVIALASAAVTGGLLLMNGSLVMGFLDGLPPTAPAWVRKPEVIQFLLFLLPVVLVVIQWIAIDYVRKIFRVRPQE